MQFGDAEWFEKLAKIAKFPSVFAFYVGSDKTINTKLIETKAEFVGNITYKTLGMPWHLDGLKTALASVIRCETTQEYYEECKRLMDAWGVVPEASNANNAG